MRPALRRRLLTVWVCESWWRSSLLPQFSPQPLEASRLTLSWPWP